MAAPDPPPLRLVGGTVLTLDPRRPRARGLAVAGGRVAALDPGEREDGPPVDLAGRCVVPGFSDAHVHFATWAIGLGELALHGAESRPAVLAHVAAAAATGPADGWIRGAGWRDAGWDAPPDAAMLDRVAGDRPVALVARDGHSLWLSSAGLARASGELERPGGVVERDAAGRPTGVLRERAAWAFRDAWLRPSPAETERAMAAALPVAASAGVTAVHDKDGGLDVLPAWQALHARGALALRVWQSLPAAALDALEAGGIRAGAAGDAWLRVGYLKAFADGTLGSGTARMLDGSGVELTSAAALAELVRRGARLGYPFAVHAIGDGANRAALDAFAAARDEPAARGLRHRIEHAQLVSPDDVARFAALGVAASVQFAHQTSDRDLADAAWGERARHAYAWRTLLRAGARLANGSDAPVEALDPLAGLRAAVRRSDDGRPPWHPDERLEVLEALEAICAAPAWLAYAEATRGRLAPGMDADLVVLGEDPTRLAPDELDGLRVEATMVGGRWSHPGPFG